MSNLTVSRSKGLQSPLISAFSVYIDSHQQQTIVFLQCYGCKKARTELVYGDVIRAVDIYCAEEAPKPSMIDN
jgi:hypothetical protein